MTSRDQRLRHVLADQRFPAARWELIVGAEFYGADAATRNELQAPPRRNLRQHRCGARHLGAQAGPAAPRRVRHVT